MEKIKETARELFTAYLQQRRLRKTPERYAILEEIYSHAGHFDVESLYLFMKNNNYRVSRATIYNTIDLLLECKLVIKHQFGNNIAQFEKAYTNKKHEHIVCKTCGKIEEFADPILDEIVQRVEETHEFTAHHYLLYIHGICKECKKAGKE